MTILDEMDFRRLVIRALRILILGWLSRSGATAYLKNEADEWLEDSRDDPAPSRSTVDPWNEKHTVKREQEKSFFIGFAMAVGALARDHDQPSVGLDIMRGYGITIKDFEDAGVDSFDTKALRREVKSDPSRSMAKRLEAQGKPEKER
jgi:hypothetical protein